MTNLFRKTAQWIDSVSAAHGRSAVIYSRGPHSSHEISAGFGIVSGEAFESGGATFATREQDFIFSIADLKKVGYWPPKLDDIIKVPKTSDSIDGNTGTFQVASANGLEHWRPSDEHGIAVRVHTQRISD